MAAYYLGIDVGTTGTKSILFDEKGNKIADSYLGYETENCEQNALDWWDAVKTTVRSVTKNVDKNAVAALSLSTQGGTVVPTDKDFNPIRRAILWSDTRCAVQREEYLSEVGPENLMYEKTGWMLVYALPLLETRWIKDNEPEIFNKAAYFLTVHDFISAKLTGIPAVDMSNAGINEYLNVRDGIYDRENLAFAGICEKQLAKIVKTGDVVGHLTKEAAEELGLTEKTVFAAGAHDQYCVSVGAGITKGGETLVGSGTSWAVTAISDRPRFDLAFRQFRSAIDGMWGSITSISSGGVCLEWLRKNVISGETLLDYKQLDADCEKVKASENGIFFFPFGEKLSDEESPCPGEPRGTFTGLTLSCGKTEMARAVMEGICFQTRWLFEEFGGMPDTIYLAGGAAKSSFWTQMLADVLNVKIRIPSVADAACTGAAVIAACAAGQFENAEAGCREFVTVKKTVLPDEAGAEKYKKAYGEYRRIAANLKKIYYGV